MMFGIDYLLSPCSLEEFVQDIYGKKSVFIEGDEKKFDGLFGWDDVNHLAQYSPVGNRSQRLIMDKKDISAYAFKDFAKWAGDGATLAINHLQTKHPLLDQYARILSGELNTRININSYISAETKQGFDNHFDKHDVFIIQTAGVKHWKVFWPTHEHPLEYMNIPKNPPEDAEPYLECDMSPGDVLYIPRGHWHYALAKNSSIHLTVGATAITPIDFLQWFIGKQMWSNKQFRKDFPILEHEMFHGRFEGAELEGFVNDFRKSLEENLNNDRFPALFKEFVMDSNRLFNYPVPALPHQHLVDENLNLDTVFQLPLGQKVLLQYDEQEKTGTILARGITVDLKNISKKVLADIFAGDLENITGRKILESNPGADEEGLKMIMKTLLAKGVLELKV